MLGTTGHFSVIALSKAPLLSRHGAVENKKPLTSMALRGSMLRGKSKCMDLPFPRCLAAFSDFIGEGRGEQAFYKCIVSLSSNSIACVVKKTRKGKILRRGSDAFSEQQDHWKTPCSKAYLFFTPPAPNMSTKKSDPPPLPRNVSGPPPGNKWFGA